MIRAIRIAIIFVLSAAWAPAQAPGERTLTILVEERTLSSWEAIERLARRFEAENPGVKVRMLDASGASGARDKVKVMLAGGLALDVIRIDVTEFGAYLLDGAITDLEPFVRKDPDFRQDDFFPVMDAFRDARGHLYGMVQTFTPYVMYVNTDMLKRLGLSSPKPGWTWEDFRRLAMAATADTDGDGRIDRYGVSLTQWLQAVLPWIWQAGGDIFDRDGRPALDGPGAVRAFDFLHRLLFVDRVASFDATFEDQLRRGLFQADRTLFYGPVGYWETYRLKHIREFRWDVLPLPRGERAATAVAMQGYVVPRTSADPELAYRFIRALTARETQEMYASIGNGLPGRKAAALGPAFLENPFGPAGVHVFIDVLDGARVMGREANWKKVEGLLQAELEDLMLSGKEAPKTLAERMQRKLLREIEQTAERERRPFFSVRSMILRTAVPIVLFFGAFLFSVRRSRERARKGDACRAAAFLSPFAIGFCVFVLLPAAASLMLIGTDASPVRTVTETRDLGAANLTRLAADSTLAMSLRKTAAFTAISVPLGTLIALALALLCRRDGVLSSFMRTVFYLPSIISPVVIAAEWRLVLDGDHGLLNRALHFFGINGPDWLRSTDHVIWSFVFMSCFSTGAAMLVFVAGLKNVDPRLEDAAKLDGAGSFARLIHVVLPALRPMIAFNVLTGTVAAAQIFAPAFCLTQGGPGDASRFVVLYLYETAFRHLDMGYASAIAWLFFLLTAGLAAIVWRIFRVRLPGEGAAA